LADKSLVTFFKVSVLSRLLEKLNFYLQKVAFRPINNVIDYEVKQPAKLIIAYAIFGRNEKNEATTDFEQRCREVYFSL
jgi:hypothetical protein